MSRLIVLSPVCNRIFATSAHQRRRAERQRQVADGLRTAAGIRGETHGDVIAALADKDFAHPDAADSSLDEIRDIRELMPQRAAAARSTCDLGEGRN
jgi:hypothetical protein